ncbi:MAG TPA: efflux RND transporter periplasmic adaptor subunit [Syntrophomonadaceae bacterium]|nr:efflux RND transporter periplasmic adaptor subunit [Syntrophomonadaceae bacterium]
MVLEVEVKEKKKKVTMFLVLLAAASAVIMGSYFYMHQLALTREHNILTAVGTVEAKKVMASFKVPGRIEQLLVDEGSKVQKGQALANLEPRELQALLTQAQGGYQAAQSKVQEAGSAVAETRDTVEAKIKQAQALVDKAEAGLTQARQQYDRVKSLYESGGASQSQFDGAKNTLDAAQGDLDTAQGQLDQALAARTQVNIAQAQSAEAAGGSQASQGLVDAAQANFDNATLKAPIAGYITQKNLEEGEMLGAGTPVFEITDLEHTYVNVFIDEDKIGRVHLDQTAQVRVDSFPQRIFQGKVVWINDAGQFAVRKAISEQYSHDIRSFEVKIDVPNSDLLLKTGMTATVTLLEKE